MSKGHARWKVTGSDDSPVEVIYRCFRHHRTFVHHDEGKGDRAGLNIRTAGCG